MKNKLNDSAIHFTVSIHQSYDSMWNAICKKYAIMWETHKRYESMWNVTLLEVGDHGRGIL